MKAHFLVILLALPCSGFAQNLREAIENYYSDIHLQYDSEWIRSNKIRTIESVDYHQQEDSLLETSRKNKYEFNQAGMITCEQCNSVVEYEPKVVFEYDSLHRLIKKTTFTPSPKNYRQLRPSDIYVWKYNKAGELCKVLRYMMIDHIPTKTGASYFPEKLMLFACDSISYNYADSSITIFQNYAEHCSNGSVQLYSPAFVPRNIQLSFHGNGNLKERHIFDGNVKLSVEFFDSFGRPMNGKSYSSFQRLFEVLNYSGYLPKELKWLEQGQIEPVIDTDTLLVFSSEKAVGLSIFQLEQSSNHVLTVNLKTGTVQFEHETIGGYINHRGTVTIHTRHKTLFNKKLQLITHETWTSSSGDGLYEFEIQEEDLDRNNPGRYAITKYEYYENGMLKSFADFDSAGNLIHKLVNEVTYFE